MSMKILITTWGDPKNWDEVEYMFNDHRIRSRTTLSVLQKRLNPDRTIIISLDTLASNGRTYSELLKNAERVIREKADEWNIREYEVWVMPGRGKFPNSEFDGSLTDFYYLLFKRMACLLMDGFEDLEEVHLDLSHGINFMPVLTYRIIRRLLGMMALVKKVKLTVYNSDPHMKGVAGSPLRINVVEESTFNPEPYSLKANKVRVLRSRTEKNLGRVIDEAFRGANVGKKHWAFLGALYNGLPLALTTFFPDTNPLKKAIDSAEALYFRETEIIESEKGLRVLRNLEFTKHFEVMVSLWFMAELMERMGLSRKEILEVGDIEYITNSIFGYDKRFKSRILNEIRRIKEMGDKISCEWNLYNSIMNAEAGTIDKRNFIAHAGFERNAVELRKVNENIQVRYAEGAIDTVAKLAQTGLIVV